jgi:putative acetyltransferase
MHIRIASKPDSDDIRKVYLTSFPESERALIAELAVNLLSKETRPSTISLLVENNGDVIGHVAFSPVTANSDNNWLGYILAPLAVKPEYQKRHIGSQLVIQGIQRLSKNGVNILFVYGDPGYYGRFGFSADTATQYIAPYELQLPLGWQAMVLNEFNFVKAPVKITCVSALCNPELW